MKVFQSAAERKPAWVPDEVAIEKVQAPEEEEIWRPELPEVAKLPAK